MSYNLIKSTERLKGFLNPELYDKNYSTCQWLLSLEPHIYPIDPYLSNLDSVEILLEWTFKPYDISLEINFYDLSAHWHILNLSTNQFNEKYLNLNDKFDIMWIETNLKKYK